MKIKVSFVLIASAISLFSLLTLSCSGGNGKKDLTALDVTENTSGKVDVIRQSKPSMMIIPSDQFLQRTGCLSTREVNGKTLYVRDYSAFLLKNKDNKDFIRAIQNHFIGMNYPLNDLEQSLKSLENADVMDSADGLQKDAKTLLVATCHPDIVIELDLETSSERVARTEFTTTYSYNLAALDAFNNTAIASVSKSDIGDDLAKYAQKQLKNDLAELTSQVQNFFADILRNGREITFRVALAESASINLRDEYNTMGDCYSDWIRDWVKTHAKNGTANLQRNTDKEMYYTSVRISNNAADGTQYNAYEFANEFRKEFVHTFEMRAANNTQGLGDASIIIR